MLKGAATASPKMGVGEVSLIGDPLLPLATASVELIALEPVALKDGSTELMKVALLATTGLFEV